MRCPTCGTTDHEARRFCLECGTRLDARARLERLDEAVKAPRSA